MGESNWDPAGSAPPNAGVVGDTDHVASFKTGKEGSEKEGETLISDGDKSDDAKGFDSAHDHYGKNFAEDRGNYTGPGSEDPDD